MDWKSLASLADQWIKTNAMKSLCCNLAFYNNYNNNKINTNKSNQGNPFIHATAINMGSKIQHF